MREGENFTNGRMKTFASLLAALLAVTDLNAQSYWSGGVSDQWHVPGNWMGGLPFGGQSGIVDNGGTARVSTMGNVADWIVGGESFGGHVEVRAGGSLEGTLGIFGGSAGVTGSLTVRDPGSLFGVSANLYLGDQGTGSMLVENGGTVRNSSGHLGYLTGSTGTAMVTGPGTRWEMSGTTNIGFSGAGTLTVTNGATVRGGFATQLGVLSGSTGTLNLHGIPGSRGTLETSQIAPGEGAAHLAFDGGVLRAAEANANWVAGFAAGQITTGNGGAFFDTGDHHVGLQSAVSGAGAVTKLGDGILTMPAASTYTGGTTIAQGRIRMTNATGSAFGTGPVTIGAGAWLTGDGSFTGPVSVSGSFSPGDRVGTATTGEAFWNAGGGYWCEMASAEGTSGTDWDLWEVNGALTITATAGTPFWFGLGSLPDGAFIDLLDNFNPGQDYAWTVLTASGGISGDLGAVAFDTGDFLNSFSGEFSLAAEGNELVLHYTAPVPEPAALALVLPAGLVLLHRRRRGA